MHVISYQPKCLQHDSETFEFNKVNGITLQRLKKRLATCSQLLSNLDHFHHCNTNYSVHIQSYVEK